MTEKIINLTEERLKRNKSPFNEAIDKVIEDLQSLKERGIMETMIEGDYLNNFYWHDLHVAVNLKIVLEERKANVEVPT